MKGLPDVHFGKVEEPPVAWRIVGIVDGEDDDGQLDTTPEDVIRMLGFDPLELSKEVTEGGPGSGFYGHAGRPGEVGGSAKGVTVMGPKEIKKKYNWKDGSADKLWDELKAWGGARGKLASAAEYQITKGMDEGFFVKQGNEVVATALIDAKMLKGSVYVDMLATKRPGFGKRSMAVIAKRAAKLHKGIMLHALPKAVGFYEALGMKKIARKVTGGLTPFKMPYEGCLRLATAMEAKVPIEELEPDDGVFCKRVEKGQTTILKGMPKIIT